MRSLRAELCGLLLLALQSGGCGSDSDPDADSDATGSTSASTSNETSSNGGPASHTSSASSSSGGSASSGADDETASSNSTTGAPTENPDDVYGEVVEGQYHLGPVDFAESEWHNACAPQGGYSRFLTHPTGLMGEYLAGVSNELSEGGGVCDACIAITTETGRSVVARVVTYGVSNAAGDLDVSPSVYETLNTDEFPRAMSWQFAKCPDTGNIVYEFQTEANQWWTSLWVRNPRVPLAKVEVKSQNHASYYELARGSDGTLTDASGFGEGEFTLRLTAIDGQVIEETLPSFSAGELVQSEQQFE